MTGALGAAISDSPSSLIAAPRPPSWLAKATQVLRPVRKGDLGIREFASSHALPRGLRNNNPGNIDKSAAHWVGEILPGNDPRFCQFDSMTHGARAMAKLLLTHYERGARTIPQLIAIWAPPSENNTAAYVKAVTARAWSLALQPGEIIGASRTGIWPITSRLYMLALCVAIAEHENGVKVATAAGTHDPLFTALVAGVLMVTPQ